jgi:phosphoribosylformimino-5-aminoimidazole carboxamide ribotide isomerase
MIVIPAVDLRGGYCVQLVGGDYADERVRLDDPAAVAREWARVGFSRLHVVDLDAATGRGTNSDVIRDILRDATVPVQIGGGIRDEAQIDRAIDDGASWVVIGTRAIQDEDWRGEMAHKFPGRIIIARSMRYRNAMMPWRISPIILFSTRTLACVTRCIIVIIFQINSVKKIHSRA